MEDHAHFLTNRHISCSHSYQALFKQTVNTNNSKISVLGRFTMYNIVPKLQKCWTHKTAFNII